MLKSISVLVFLSTFVSYTIAVTLPSSGHPHDKKLALTARAENSSDPSLTLPGDGSFEYRVSRQIEAVQSASPGRYDLWDVKATVLITNPPFQALAVTFYDREAQHFVRTSAENATRPEEWTELEPSPWQGREKTKTWIWAQRKSSLLSQRSRMSHAGYDINKFMRVGLTWPKDPHEYEPEQLYWVWLTDHTMGRPRKIYFQGDVSHSVRVPGLDSSDSASIDEVT